MLQWHSKQAMLVLRCVYQAINHKYEWADELRNQFSIEDLNASTVSILGDWTSLSDDTEERMTGEDVSSSLSNDVLFGFFPISKTRRRSHDSRNSRAKCGKAVRTGPWNLAVSGIHGTEPSGKRPKVPIMLHVFQSLVCSRAGCWTPWTGEVTRKVMHGNERRRCVFCDLG